nr:ribonuclease H-like domain-containing protein [Tanacetum cinerariifolium]
MSYRDSEIVVLKSNKKVLGYVNYNDVPPPHTRRFSPPRIDLSHTGLPEFSEPSIKSYGVKPIEVVTHKSSVKISAPVRENNGAPFIEDWESENRMRLGANTIRGKDGNIYYLTYFKEFDVGYVAFGRGAKGGKIIGKGTIRTGKLNFEDMYFVKELQFNLFGVSQTCDKKNSVLFTDTKCFVLSPDFKLADESHVLFKVSRKNKMYSVDMKNIVPKKNLTFLVAKATNDESMLWHKRLATKDETSRILKSFITEIENLVAKKVKIIRCNNGTEFKNRVMNDFCEKKDEGFFVGYSTNSKAFRVYNTITRKVEENLHIKFLENKPLIAGDGPKWLFYIDTLTESMNYVGFKGLHGVTTAQYKFPLPVKVVATARRFEMPLPEVCTAIEEKKKKLPVKDRWQLH